MRRYWIAMCGLALITSPLAGQDWERANAQVRRLDPSVFGELPEPVSTYLRTRGCTVPQAFRAKQRSGVIRGHFTSPTRLDWAVLCSVRQVSTILVFRGGSVARVDELARLEDSTFLQVVDVPDVVGYSREISVATPAHIRSHGADGTVARIEHDGIEDSFVEKGSTIQYWSGGRWRELPGAD
jgi:hypothetical protein